VLFSPVSNKRTDLHLSLLYILILGACSKFARKNNFLALGICFLQTCTSTGRMFAASRSRLHYYWQIVSFWQRRMNLMKCRVNWIPLRIRTRSRNTQGYSKPKKERKNKFNGQPRRFAIQELVPNWYNHFHLIILIRRKSTTQPCWVIKQVPRNLVRSIRSWSIRVWSSAQDLNICTERSIKQSAKI